MRYVGMPIRALFVLLFAPFPLMIAVVVMPDNIPDMLSEAWDWILLK